MDDKVNWKKVRVLVYMKNGKGYVHDNIPNAVLCIQKLGQQHGFTVDVSDQPGVFTENNLAQYTALIFPSTNNDVFDTDAQRLAFRRYIEAGGGFVGIHSVMGTERNWTWFKRMLGGTFAWHPRFQKLRLTVIDTKHPSMQGLPKTWEKEDECYFAKDMSPGPTVVMVYDLTALDQTEKEKIKTFGGSYTEVYPAAWFYHFDGGHTWCTALGHDKKDYEDPTFTQHIFQGLRFVASQVKKVDFSRAYADSRDTPIRY
ncbi:hypothetical protein GCM10028825_43250 [Spirosoma agri]